MPGEMGETGVAGSRNDSRYVDRLNWESRFGVLGGRSSGKSFVTIVLLRPWNRRAREFLPFFRVSVSSFAFGVGVTAGSPFFSFPVSEGVDILPFRSDRPRFRRMLPELNAFPLMVDPLSRGFAGVTTDTRGEERRKEPSRRREPVPNVLPTGDGIGGSRGVEGDKVEGDNGEGDVGEKALAGG